MIQRQYSYGRTFRFVRARVRRKSPRMNRFPQSENPISQNTRSHEATLHPANITPTVFTRPGQAQNQPGPGKIAQNNTQTENALSKKGGTTTLSRDARVAQPPSTEGLKIRRSQVPRSRAETSCWLSLVPVVPFGNFSTPHVAPPALRE